MLPVERLDAILARAQALQDEMNGELPPERFVELSKEYAEIDPLANAVRAYRAALTESEDLAALAEGEDGEMAELARLELDGILAKLPDMETALEVLLLPKDSADELNVIVEVRAGTGGDEAALFAGDLFRMYTRYADLQGWKSDIITQSEGEMGGYKEVVMAIRGKGVFARLKFESGVHRVQRVPETESSGRIHTSAATVAVLPEPEDVDIKI
ncbi:MAG: PCRF domain-containing protein, partial [Rhodobiaceae bacterium]|nr:PCRF domain-containing protein [Rhodobiaceae bacterium]